MDPINFEDLCRLIHQEILVNINRVLLRIKGSMCLECRKSQTTGALERFINEFTTAATAKFSLTMTLYIVRADPLPQNFEYKREGRVITM